MPDYNINPGPVSGTNPFGYIPGPVGTPDPYADLSKVFPGLGAANSQVSSDLLNQLKGVLSPETQAAIQDASARFGVRSGMPGSGLVANRTARDLGLTTEQLQQQGLQNYNSLIPTISGTQTLNPAQQIALAQWNAINRSAPDPTQAANYAKQLFDEYLARMRGPAGGTGNYASPTQPAAPAATPGRTGPGAFPAYPYAGPSTPGTGDASSYPADQAGDPLDAVFGTDPATLNDLGDWWNQAPVGTVTTPDASLAPGSVGTYWNQPTDLFSGQDFYDLGGF